MVHQKREDKIESGFKYTGPLRPFPYSFTGKRVVPKDMNKPDYATTGAPSAHFQALADKAPPIYSGEDLVKIKAACKIARGAIDAGHRAVKVGVTTEEIDRVVHEYCISQGAYPSPLNYYKFPRSCCTSVNEVICHGIPDTRPLEDGDIVNLDISIYKDKFHADMNETYLVGNVSQSSKDLVKAAYDCL